MKSIIITGAGSGIGQAAAIELEAAGHRLILVGRTQSKLDSTLASLQKPQIHHTLSVDIATAGTTF